MHRILLIFVATLFLSSCGEVKNGKDGSNENSTNSGTCSIATCKEGSVLDASTCACITGTIDGGDIIQQNSCQINACNSGFVLEPTACQCLATSNTQQNNNQTAGNRPVKGTATLMNKTGAPAPRVGHSAVWTGTEMIVWGGSVADNTGKDVKVNDGAAFNPTTDSWRSLSVTGAPSARHGHKAVWTGKYMVIIGSDVDVFPVKAVEGGVYDPATDSWKAISSTSAPTDRSYYSVAAVGGKVAVWGGNTQKQNGGSYTVEDLSNGAVYDPELDTWAAMSDTGSPTTVAGGQNLLSVDGKLVVFGGINSSAYQKVNQFGALYDLALNGWSQLPLKTELSFRYDKSSALVLAGKRMIFVTYIDLGANQGLNYYQNTFDFSSQTWSQKDLGKGNEKVCGGYEGLWTDKYIVQLDTHCLYNPDADEIYALPVPPHGVASNEVPEDVDSFKINSAEAVWTGSELLMFGGWYDTIRSVDCPDGAPCAGPESFSGRAYGIRVKFDE